MENRPTPSETAAFLDRPDILNVLFHPRRDFGSIPPANGENLDIPVADGVTVSGRFHLHAPDAPLVLFFHGNGEIASDYDMLAALYRRIGLNFLPVDYRGYGRSGGTPTASAMMADCFTIFEYVAGQPEKYGAPLFVMGRSLGSASAIAVAEKYPNRVAGLIVESGFARTGLLLRTLGVLDSTVTDSEHVGNADRIAEYEGPTLIIHASEDHIIPFRDGVILYESSGSEQKEMLKIPAADHNNILFFGRDPYFDAISRLVQRAVSG